MEHILDLGERFLAEILGVQHVLFAASDQIADRANVCVLEAVVRTYRKLEFVNRFVEQIVAHERRTCDVLVFILFFFLFEIDKDRHVIFHQFSREADRIFRGDAAVGPNFERQTVIFRIRTLTRFIDVVVNFLDRRMNRIDRNITNRKVFVVIELSRDITTSLLEPHFDVERTASTDRRDVNRRIENFDITVGLNVSARYDACTFLDDRKCFRPAAVKRDRNLFKVQDNVGSIFDDAFDR